MALAIGFGATVVLTTLYGDEIVLAFLAKRLKISKNFFKSSNRILALVMYLIREMQEFTASFTGAWRIVMRRVKSGCGAICALLLVVIVIATVRLIYTRPTSSGNYVNISPYEKVSFEEAEQQTGFTIPMPDYVPDGYVLEGVYLYPRTESVDAAGDASLPPRPPFEQFQVVFTRGMDVLILRLEGGDTRGEETYARTGGDIPTDFNIQGNRVDVNGTIGVTESGLEKISIIGAKMHSRLTWRLPCTSTKMPILTALFLVLESNVLSTSELLEIATSVPPCIPASP